MLRIWIGFALVLTIQVASAIVCQNLYNKAPDRQSANFAVWTQIVLSVWFTLIWAGLSVNFGVFSGKGFVTICAAVLSLFDAAVRTPRFLRNR